MFVPCRKINMVTILRCIAVLEAKTILGSLPLQGAGFKLIFWFWNRDWLGRDLKRMRLIFPAISVNLCVHSVSTIARFT